MFEPFFRISLDSPGVVHGHLVIPDALHVHDDLLPGQLCLQGQVESLVGRGAKRGGAREHCSQKEIILNYVYYICGTFIG